VGSFHFDRFGKKASSRRKLGNASAPEVMDKKGNKTFD
jgi:hypothetical protein